MYRPRLGARRAAAARPLTVVVLSPRRPHQPRPVAADGRTRPRRGRGGALVRGARRPRRAAADGAARSPRRWCGYGTWCIGDPFSRLVQVLLPLCRAAKELTVVDDGTATMEFTEILARGGRLVRWHRSGRRRSPVDAAFGAVLDRAPGGGSRPAAGRRIELFSAMPATAAARDDAARQPVRLDPRPVRAAAHAGRHRPDRHVAGRDRRRRPRALPTPSSARSPRGTAPGGTSRTAGRPRTSCTGSPPRPAWRSSGPTCRSNSSPAAARSGARCCRFPSTVVHTLPLALAGTGVDIVVCDIDEEWLTSAASPRAHGFLTDITHSAREPPRVASGGQPEPCLALLPACTAPRRYGSGPLPGAARWVLGGCAATVPVRSRVRPGGLLSAQLPQPGGWEVPPRAPYGCPLP